MTDRGGAASLEIAAQFKGLAREKPAYWFVCLYLFFEYFRPQAIYPAIDFLPWAQLFLILAVVAAFFDPTVGWVRHKANFWVLLFSVIIGASILTAEYKDVANEHVIDYFGWPIIYFVCITIVNSRRRLFFFLTIFMLASFKISLSLTRAWAARGFSFTEWGLQGPRGYFHNSGELAIQMLMFAPLAYYYVFSRKNSLSRYWYLAWMSMPITAALVVLGASSRGAQLGLAYQLFEVFLRKRINLRTVAVAISLALALFALLPEEQKERFTDMGSDKTSQQRLLYWKHGLTMMIENPILGVGYYGFAPHYERHYPQDLLYKNAQLPHNIFIQVGTDAGIVGLLIYLGVMYSSYRSCQETQRLSKSLGDGGVIYENLARAVNISLAGFLVAGQFVTVAYYPFSWINLVMAVCLNNVVRKEVSEQRSA